MNIVKRNIQKITPDTNVSTISKNVISQEVLSKLKNCDVIFSCTDTHASRSVLNELAHQYFIPVIDVGVGMDSKHDKIIGGTVRVTLSSPSLPCLYCVGIINPERILSESLTKEDRESRMKEGYISGMVDDVPSVITFTTIAASYASLLFKDLFFNFIDSNANTIILDMKSFTTSRLVTSPKDDCVCSVRRAKADYMPLSAP